MYAFLEEHAEQNADIAADGGERVPDPLRIAHRFNHPRIDPVQIEGVQRGCIKPRCVFPITEDKYILPIPPFHATIAINPRPNPIERNEIVGSKECAPI